MRSVLRSFQSLVLLSAMCSLAVPAVAHEGHEAEKKPAQEAATPTVEEQIAGLEAMCAEATEAREKRQAEESLYLRLGKDEKIHALTKEVVRLHLENDAIKHLFKAEYADSVAERVAKFMISGTGGPQVYKGPSLEESHANMKLTNADFLAAGGDIIQAMKNLEYPQSTIDDLVCALVSMRTQVILPEEPKQKKD